MKIFTKLVICFLLFGPSAFGLVPIEGLIFGDVKNIQQYDPFRGMLSYNYSSDDSNKSENLKLQYYQALYRQGIELDNSCQNSDRLQYSSSLNKQNAAKSVAATLQYIGIDITVKAIAAYAKKLELNNVQYSNLVQNLVKNSCSKNMTVYSVKLVEENLMSEWNKKQNFILPSIGKSSFFSKSVKDLHESYATVKKHFNYTVKNFNAFCSWSGNTSDYRMLSSYLKNPYIMSILLNNLTGHKVGFDRNTQQLIKYKNNESIQVACEDTICRRRPPEVFLSLFPRRIGSNKIKDDIQGLYCDHFSKQTYKESTTNAKIKKWINNQGFLESKLEPLNFISLVSGIPETLLAVENVSKVKAIFKENIVNHWDSWSESKLSQQYFEQYFEEPLEIQLVPQQLVNNPKLEAKFIVTLGEIDKVLNDIDKISAQFDLKFSQKYITFLKQRTTELFNLGREDESLVLRAKFIENISRQLSKKTKFFKVPIWNNKISTIIADELLINLDRSPGSKFNRLKAGTITVPVEFDFGTFALQYIHRKYNFIEKKQEALTFN